MKRIIILCLLIVAVCSQIQAQIIGTVINKNGNGIEFVNATLLNQSDSFYISGTITDSLGQFILPSYHKPALLKFSSIGYKVKTVPYQEEGTRVYLLEENEVQLSEATVVGERPLVNTSDGTLRFSVPSLIKGKPINNALDVLGEIPGIEKNGDKISIMGAGSTTIILNGRKKTLSTDQLTQLLKSTPVSRIKNVEILYSPPPEYGVQGAAINIIYDSEKKLDRKGEFYLSGKQVYYLSPSSGLSILLSNRKSTIDFGYNYSYNKSFTEENLDAVHSLNTGNIHRILQENDSRGRNSRHDIRFGLDHNFSKESSLAVALNSSFQKPKSERAGIINVDSNLPISSINKLKDTKNLQNISLDFKYKLL